MKNVYTLNSLGDIALIESKKRKYVKKNKDHKATLKLQECEVYEIRDIYRNKFHNQAHLAKMYGVSQGLITAIVTNKIYLD